MHGDSSIEEIEGPVKAAKKLGAHWTRVLVPWHFIEHERGHYDWQYVDRTVGLTEKHGLNVMMQVSTAPTWATSVDDLSARQLKSLDHYEDSYAPKPEHYSDYATFFAATVERYSPRGIQDYEVWNEPAMDRFWKESYRNKTTSPESYTELLKSTYPAAHRANPDVNVLAGGQIVYPTADDESVMNAVDYLKRMYAAGAHGYFDSLSHHPYGIDAPEWIWNGWAYIDNDPRTESAPADTLRSVMSDNGDGDKPIWLTEAGKPTTAGSDDEETQAENYRLYLDVWRNTPNLGPILFYEVQDQASYGQEDPELYFGVLRHDGSLKPAAHVIKDYTQDVGR